MNYNEFIALPEKLKRKFLEKASEKLEEISNKPGKRGNLKEALKDLKAIRNL